MTRRTIALGSDKKVVVITGASRGIGAALVNYRSMTMKANLIAVLAASAEMHPFCAALAQTSNSSTRIASFDRQAIVDTKKLVDLASMRPDAEIQPGWDAFISSLQRPAAQARVKALVDKGLQQLGDVEKRLGQFTANYDD